MQYKTIALELLQQRPQIHDLLRKERKLLPAVEMFARELKTRHEAWKETLGQENPAIDRSQIAFQALEMALKDLEDRLLPALHPNDNETFSLDAAMAFIRKPTSRE
jgi:hypothetical protein